MATGADLVTIGRRYIGVPYQHMGRPAPGEYPTGLDCAQLLLLCAQEADVIPQHVSLTPYPKYPRPRDFEQLKAYCTEIPKEDAWLGDILVMRNPLRLNRLWHLAMKTDIGVLWVHPLPSIAQVAESRLGPDTERHIVAAWRFNGLENA